MYDANNIKKLKKYAQLTPTAWEKFISWDGAVMADGAIPAKTKELIALAVASTTQCVYCLEIHTKKAKNLGCSDAEIAEAVMVSAAIRAGGSITHGTHCFAD
jgi:AhpD family alkylhydroperoxidase